MADSWAAQWAVLMVHQTGWTMGTLVVVSRVGRWAVKKADRMAVVSVCKTAVQKDKNWVVWKVAMLVIRWVNY